ncbi:MAG: precorrin-6A reductase [Eubacterium sp.]|nr:precorrin-6A reductase [Eubacterium sp.]
MRFVVFSGTTEGRMLSEELSDMGALVTVCVASQYGSEMQGQHAGITICTGPLQQEEKTAVLQGAAACIDATHPYALHVTKTVKQACEQAGVRYIRLVRPDSDMKHAVVVRDTAEAAAYLKDKEGRILLTTGVKELRAFRDLDPSRLYPRVLPSCESLQVCADMGIPSKNIMAMQGPFSRELNEALIRQYHISFLVSKDGGKPGGFPEKAEAAEAAGITLLVIGREKEEGMTYQETRNLCMSLMQE